MKNTLILTEFSVTLWIVKKFRGAGPALETAEIFLALALPSSRVAVSVRMLQVTVAS